MKKFRKIPIQIEAVRIDTSWFEGKGLKPPIWYDRRLNVIDNDDNEKKVVKISTLEGKMSAHVSDWIIRGVEGELYPCKDSIFQKTYEEVSDKPLFRGKE